MSGKISQQDFDSLLARHGYKNNGINIEKLIKPDEALYNTILEMQTKYTNPKLSFSGFFYNLEERKNEPERQRYNFITNTYYLHQLDARMLDFKNISQEDSLRAESMMGLTSPDTRKEYLLNNRVTEECHAKQVAEM